ncbi:Brix-domain-containing protein [Meira miltonrushii]|uniref:Brix-domain-containing protein n=1 Tax=Meira miltonrushii TaxID=1280837 RepID=A0A316VC90_9BASI|nr:Brix-domain-containing protein [Meira miltonrushii]PWN33873.1 Brix-domain-containing protein [Meira miltonrushii]
MASSSSDATPVAGGKGEGNFKHIGNKMKRQEMYRKHRKTKREEKLKKRIQQAKEEKGEGGAEKKKARLAKNIPRTIERTRDYNPTIINAPNTHDGPGYSLPVEGSSKDLAESGDEEQEGDVEEEEEMDEEEDEDDPHAPPALLITTSLPSNSTSPHLSSANARSHPAERTREFVDELLNIFPGAEYRPRAKAKGVGLGKIAGWARTRGYNGMIVVGEDKKEPFSLTIIGLPEGPTAFFRLTNIAMRTEIEGHGRSTGHTPELILNNFTTSLGHQIGTLLQSLFPRIPQLEGRQVVTAHNQRDYIFFRRHRYMFKHEEKANLQEIGPRFTLKLRSLKDGLPKGAGVWDGEIHFDGKPKEVAAPDEDGEQSSEQTQTKRKRTQRIDDEQTGLSFEWKPKMGVSRRNFYL